MPQIQTACSGASRIARVVLAMLPAPSSRSLPTLGLGIDHRGVAADDAARFERARGANVVLVSPCRQTSGYDLSGTAHHRDAQMRHALIRLLHWAKRHNLAIAVEDLDFTADKTRERHGHRKKFRKLISVCPAADGTPPHDRSDRAGHRSVQAGPGT
jgi:hypothetical protein